MASFGKVLDLLDERYLNLQDVYGNVEPLPSLVPYDDYTQTILVYRMDTNHELFMGLLHDFTARMSQQLSQELWTWFVQWEVDADRPPAPSPKKIRLYGPIIDIFERCVLDSKLFEREEMLRILIDIVQVESSIVPNFIEFLYRWIDFYEGDGKALKAALKWEIPSLWDFEYHPLLLPEDLKKTNERHKLMEAEERKLMLANAGQGGHVDKATVADSTERLAEASPTKKMREKPDLAAIERQTEASERLQYREVKYGIQPPKLDTPLSPLINIPRNPLKRLKYYCACFRSRQRALIILLEAGLTLQQIGGYQRLQDESVRDTPTLGVPEDPKKMSGLRHYHKESDPAQLYFKEKEKLRSQRDKQTEIALSHKLAFEAQLATQSAAADGASGVPLIPPTPSYTHRPDMAADMLARIRAARGKGEQRINFVPSPMVGLMKARLFEDARDMRLMIGPNRSGQNQVHQSDNLPHSHNEEMDTGSDQEMNSSDEEEMEHGSDEEMDSDSDTESGSDSDNSSDSVDGATPGALSTPTNPIQSRAYGHPVSAGLFPAVAPPHGAPDFTGATGTATRPLPPPSSEVLARYLQSMIIRPTAPMSQLPPLPQLPVRPDAPNQSLPGPERRSLQSLQSNHASTLAMPLLPSSDLPVSTPGSGSSFSIENSLAMQRQRAAQAQGQSAPKPLSVPTLSIPRPNFQRTTAPTPLSLAPPPNSPFTSLAPSLLCTTPFQTSNPNRIPILIYFPRIVLPGLPRPFPLGDNHSTATDAFMLGYTNASDADGEIELTKALLLPTGCWTNVLGKVQRGRWTVLETYQPPVPTSTSFLFPEKPHPSSSSAYLKVPIALDTPHRAAYAKLAMAFRLAHTHSPRQREAGVTKRWRASPGPLGLRDRGAVWEGWGVVADRGVSMSREEREGAFVICGARRSEEEKRRERELEELMEMEEREGVEWGE
ncbi:hypothetical protein DE146DRAFT_767682 [Phaeosphaeria sp. MPI-PUGE-AT-0046c]|nr:hypothetical protein DE146DRAFT_767682 [Phaeosphaeria sp. MPI-PUGE-AT-0046c]